MISPKYRNLIFRIKSKIFKEFFLLLNFRPSSYPYVSGDAFRSISDHVYDEAKKLDPLEVGLNNIVFVKTDLIYLYFRNIHPKIQNKYKLITHNSDGEIGEAETKFIDDKIIHWFAQNNTFPHPKITQIPIGIENKYWHRNGYILIRIIDKIKKSVVIKKNRILFGFNINTNHEKRYQAINVLRKSKFADEIKRKIHPKNYFKLLNTYKFVASPEGNGPDCIRTWEAMLLNTVPVVTRSYLTDFFKQLGLPMLVIDKWTDINQLDDKLIQNTYLNIKSSAKTDGLHMDYWIEKIKSNIS